MMEKLPKEIVERVIVWLSNNQELWTKTVDQTSSRQCISFEQVCNPLISFAVSV